MELIIDHFLLVPREIWPFKCFGEKEPKIESPPGPVLQGFHLAQPPGNTTYHFAFAFAVTPVGVQRNQKVLLASWISSCTDSAYVDHVDRLAWRYQWFQQTKAQPFPKV